MITAHEASAAPGGPGSSLPAAQPGEGVVSVQPPPGDAGGVLPRESLVQQTHSLPVGWEGVLPVRPPPREPGHQGSPAQELGHPGAPHPHCSRGHHTLGTVELTLRPRRRRLTGQAIFEITVIKPEPPRGTGSSGDGPEEVGCVVVGVWPLPPGARPCRKLHNVLPGSKHTQSSKAGNSRSNVSLRGMNLGHCLK